MINYKISAVFIGFAVFFCSCGSKTTAKSEKEIVKSEPMIDSIPKNNEQNLDYKSPPAKGGTELRFKMATLVVHLLETGRIFDFNGDGFPSDTLEVEYDLPESVQGQSIYIKTSELTDLKLEWRYETSLTLNMEGPHWDLYDWKHYYSPWKELKLKKGKYYVPELTRSETQIFPKYSEAELNEFVNLDSLRSEHSGSNADIFIGVSRIYLRITGMGKNRKHTYIVAFYEPMGC